MKRFFSHINLDKNQIVILFLLPTAILVSMSIVSYMNSLDILENQKKINETIKYLDAVQTLRQYVNESQYSRNQYLITNDKSILDSYYRASALVDSQYNKVRALCRDDVTQKQYLDTISGLIKEKFELFNRGIEIQNKQGNDYRLHKTMIADGAYLHNKITRVIFNMRNDESNLLRVTMELESSKANFTVLTMVLGTLFSIILFIILFVILLSKTGQLSQADKQHRLTPDELETIVRERTAELSKINNRLNRVITEHERTEAALRQSETDLRSLFEQAHDAIIIFTPEDQKVLEVNKRATEIYGISKEQFAGISLNAIFKNYPENVEHIKNTLEKGYYYNFQTVHYRKNGTEMLMEINASVINYRGQTAILSINRDITERILSLIPLPGS